jgi:hypothetical protein
MNEMAKQEERAVSRPLKVLVPLIQEQLKLGEEVSKKAGLPYYREVGMMLLEARPQVGRGEWKDWLKRNFHLSYNRAGDYCRFAEAFPEKTARATFPFRTLSDFSDPGRATHHRPVWHEPVRDSVNRIDTRIEQLTQERQNKQKEAKLLHDLGVELINIGYKVLATKLHPDKGGSREAMARLNRVRDILRAAI